MSNNRIQCWTYIQDMFLKDVLGLWVCVSKDKVVPRKKLVKNNEDLWIRSFQNRAVTASPQQWAKVKCRAYALSWDSFP